MQPKFLSKYCKCIHPQNDVQLLSHAPVVGQRCLFLFDLLLEINGRVRRDNKDLAIFKAILDKARHVVHSQPRIQCQNNYMNQDNQNGWQFTSVPPEVLSHLLDLFLMFMLLWLFLFLIQFRPQQPV